MATVLQGAAPAYIAKEYGGSFEEIEQTISVLTTVTKLVGNNPERLALILINVGANDVYVKPSNNPGVEQGLLLAAFGGSVSLNVRSDLTLPTREWYGIADTTASTVYAIEVNRYAPG